jgi:hypothetical protein
MFKIIEDTNPSLVTDRLNELEKNYIVIIKEFNTTYINYVGLNYSVLVYIVPKGEN